ncbi:cysteine proteinase [Yamadazyma tenuis ATCC 10573]|uniref:Ubiquitin carboxyl-terminal hydrolase n=1 Tax=Candida tenuis (strain ATCC 10573 / BCRC 21748 / CBS 615 / JCM 9827 / NBRC 10315 / NRRL Y-1498 / VKM Y-70) TaxID=590646 RepID=G3AXT7_CANTC|nr:cysteine proteinase [Yamadazyma tenuis ATCC 10573]EGV65692.1 cysteine proteinase [Yamadazyma tenuis ATCC 10573]
MFEDLGSCQHIRQVLNSKARENVLITYKQAIKIALLVNKSNNFRLLKDNSSFSADKLIELKLNALKCSNCKLCNFNNNLICLQCPNIGCQINNHGYNHYKLNQHVFAIDSENGLIYCFKCNTYINDKALNDIRNEVRPESSLELPESDDTSDHYDTPEETSIRGLKGFVNFGSTCFISSILQTLIHNPMLKREFFNSDEHYFNCDVSECITCSIDKIFTEFFTSSNNDSFGMTNLLINSWYKNKSLTGYEEQDAHEFWQYLLNEFHKDHMRLKSDMGENDVFGHTYEDCDCITHKHFAGELESLIMCSDCDNTTRTIDPIMDLSLELTNLPDHSTVYDCLNLFTKEETLENYKCQFCNKNSKPKKSLKINKMSSVLSIQLKRFKHNVNSFIKNDIPIRNPLYLNLSDYLSQDSNEGSTNQFYELFALVVHIGSVNTGHYVVLIKTENNQWLKFDDSIITLVPQQEIESINAYLLFYMVHNI